MVSHDAGSPHVFIVLVRVVSMLIEELVLEEGHAIARGVTLIWVSASIPHHDSLEVDDPFPGGGELVEVEYLVGQVRDINACIALSSHIEVVLLQVGEFLKEC